MADRPEEKLPVRRDEAAPASRPANRADESSGFLYRAGEGYWVRVITAVAVAAMFLSGAAWSYQSLTALQIPNKAWDVSVNSLSGEVSNNTEVEYITRATTSGLPEVLGTGRVVQVTPRGPKEAILRVEGSKMTSADKEPLDAQSVRIGAAGNTVEGVVKSAVGVPLFQLAYLQMSVAIVLIVGGAFLAYYIAGLRRGAVDFLIATDSEMRKVNWSTRREIVGSTNVVITAFFLIGFILFVLDFMFSKSFQAIHLLHK